MIKIWQMQSFISSKSDKFGSFLSIKNPLYGLKSDFSGCKFDENLPVKTPWGDTKHHPQ
jgi:hypothetical protein